MQARRRNFAFYRQALSDLPGIAFMPEAPWGRHTRWLTCITVDAGQFGCDREAVRLALQEADIEARPIWKPMHLQPVFRTAEAIGGAVAEAIYRDGLCLPSGSNLQENDLVRVAEVVRTCHRAQ